MNPMNNNTQEGKFECDDFGDIENDTGPKTIEFIDKNSMFGSAENIFEGDCVSAGYVNGKVDCTTLQEVTRRQLGREDFFVDQHAGGLRSRLLKGGSDDGDCVFRFEADTTILIKDGNDMVLQEQSIHTSCSKGLFVGDVYASLTVKYLLFDLEA